MKLNRYGQAKILTPDEIAAIRDDLPNPHDVVFLIGIYTAARIGEIVRLERRDVTPGWLTFRKTITKTRKTRQVAVHPALSAILAKHLESLPEQTPWVFPNSRGGFIHPDTFGHVLSNCCQRLSIRGVSTHSMRRTALANLYLQGVDLKTLQEISGHARLDHLRRYSEPCKSAMNHPTAQADGVSKTPVPAIAFFCPNCFAELRHPMLTGDVPTPGC